MKKLIYVASYMFLALFMEFITFNVMGLGVFAEYYWFDILMVGLIAMFIFIIPSFKVEAVIIILLLAIQATLSFVNQAMNNDAMLRVVFTFSDLFSTTAVAGVFTNEYVSWPFLVALVLIVLAEFSLLLYLRRIRVKTVIKTRVLATSFVVFMVCQILLGSFYGYVCANLYSPSKEDSAYYFKDDKTLYEDMDYAFKLKAFKKFGTFSFYYKNFINFLDLKSNDEIVSALNEANEFLSNNDTGGSGMSCKNGQPYTAYTGAYSGNNLIMVMMESAEWYGIDEELTPTLYALANQGITNDKYISKNKTNQSEAISMLGSFPTDCNLQEKLKSSTSDDYPFSLPSVFQRSGYNTSYMHNNVSEFYNRKYTHHALGFDNLYFYEEMSKEDGFVNHKENATDFYDFESDYEALKVMKSKITDKKDGDGFMTFYTTMCMHGNYDDLIDYANKHDLGFWDYTNSTDEQERNRFRNDSETNDFFCDYYDKITVEHFKELFPNITDVLEENSKAWQECYLRYKQYQAAYMDLDRGLHELMVYLDENNLLENTTIVLFADHDGYYSNQNYYLRGYDYFEFYKTDLYYVPFIMYDGSMNLSVSAIDYGNNLGYEAFDYASKISAKIDENKCEYLKKDENGCLKIQRWSSPYDTVPTLLDLFGYSFNMNLYQGQSVFAEYGDVDRAVFYSMESGIITDNMFMSSAGKWYYFDEKTNEYYWMYGDDFRIYSVKDNSEFDDAEGKISGMFERFSLQVDNFISKKEHLDSVYKYKLFAKKDVKNKDGNVMYDFADITKSIYKFSD